MTQDSNDDLAIMIDDKKIPVAKGQAIIQLELCVMDEVHKQIIDKMDDHDYYAKRKIAEYLSRMVYQKGFLSVGEMTTREYLAKRGYIQDEQSSPTVENPREWVIKLGDDKKSIKFTECFHIQNYIKQEDLTLQDRKHLHGDNAAIKFESTIGVKQAAKSEVDELLDSFESTNEYQIDHKVNKVNVNRNKDDSYDLFPPSTFSS